jgi:hypothetical protein
MRESNEQKERRVRVLQAASHFGFRWHRDAGGAEQLRKKQGRDWVVITAENDTLAIPSAPERPANLAVFHEDPDSESADPVHERVFPSLTAALLWQDTRSYRR